MYVDVVVDGWMVGYQYPVALVYLIESYSSNEVMYNMIF